MGANRVTKGTGSFGRVVSDGGVGFFGTVPPSAQPSGAAQAAVATTTATNSSPYGYTQAQANAIVTLLNEIRSVLVNAGMMKGSA